MARFSIRSSLRPRAALLRLGGELDLAACEHLRLALLNAQDDGCVDILLDVRRVTFVDCSALGVVETARRQVVERGGRLRLVAEAGHTFRRVAALAGYVELATAGPTVLPAVVAHRTTDDERP